MAQQIEVGRLLRGGTSAFVIGCRVSKLDVPAFGALVRVPVLPEDQVFGLIHDIRIEDDGLVRQLVTADAVTEEVILDNRERRIVPVEMSVVVVGYDHAGTIRHQLPPRPPLSLDQIFLCDEEETRRFVSVGRFGYFRHLLRVPELPLGELLAAHMRHVRSAGPRSSAWTQAAIQEIIVLLRDDYPLLSSVLGALDQDLLQAEDSQSDFYG